MLEPDDTANLVRAAPPAQSGVDREVGLSAVLQTVLRREERVRVGRFIVQGRLGAGGMGAVYRAWDPRLERTIALKLLLQADESGQRLRHEAKALAKLKHPNVVAVYDVGEDEQGGFVAMELVDGPTLRTWVETHPDGTARAVVKMFVQAGRGLAAAHAVGVVHRDFKPDNAIVGSDGRVRVVDFGIARLRGDPDATPTAGTPNAMAPEQRRGDVSDARTDQYAFCLALQRCLHAHDDGASRRQLPRDSRAAIERGLAEDPNDRWPAMDALLEALEPPTRSRRRWLALGVMAASLAGFSARGSADSSPSCPEPRSDVATSWTRHNRDALEAKFRESATPGAPEFLRRIDGFVMSWQDARVAACGLLHTERGELAATGSRRLECLDLVADGLNSFTTDLVAREGDALRYAGLAVQALPRPQDCAASHDTLVGSLPDGALLLEIQAGQVARRLFDFDGAVERITPAYKRATAEGLHRLAATAALTLSTHDNDEHDQRRQWAERALASAEKAQNTDLMVLAWINLSYTDASSDPPGPWESTLEHAVRLGAPASLSPATTARLAVAQANAAMRQGRHADALPYHEEAIAAYSGDGLNASAASIHCDKAQAHAALGQIPLGLSEIKTCLDQLSTTLGATHPHLFVRLGIGMQISLIGNDPRQTIELANRAIPIGRRGQYRARFRIAPYTYGAGAHTELGEYEDAVGLLEEGLAVAESLESTDAEASIHAQLGSTLSEAGDCVAALPHFDEALVLLRREPESHLTQGITLLNRGECLAKTGDGDAAMADVEGAWEVFDFPQTSTLGLKQVRLDAQVSLFAGRLERAAEKLAVVEERAESVSLPPADLAYALYLRARVEAKRNNAPLAHIYIDRAEKAYAGHVDGARSRYREFQAWLGEYDLNHPAPP
ncbi:MAG: protein kinase domain-containing protein [Nannocystales bacterium]